MTDAVTTAAGASGVRVRLGVATRRNGRDRNEDAVGIGGWVLTGDGPEVIETIVPVAADGAVTVAVVDGMGGHAAGHLAARVAAEHLTRVPARTGDELADAFRRADDAIHDRAGLETTGMGAAAAAATVLPSGEIVVANLGDVRAYRIVNGYPAQLTVDDRPSGPRTSPPTGAITRYLGGTERRLIEAHVTTCHPVQGGRLLLCTDGIHDAVGAAEMRRCLHGEVRDTAQALLAAAGRDGDNATALVLELTTAPIANHERGAVPEPVASALDGVILRQPDRRRSSSP